MLYSKARYGSSPWKSPSVSISISCTNFPFMKVSEINKHIVAYSLGRILCNSSMSCACFESHIENSLLALTLYKIYRSTIFPNFALIWTSIRLILGYRYAFMNSFINMNRSTCQVYKIAPTSLFRCR